MTREQVEKRATMLWEVLTEDERQVFNAWVDIGDPSIGKVAGNKEIARQLGISRARVSKARRGLVQKIDIFEAGM
jgi:DNA-binding CsgD family transcriptional regulator